MNFIRDALTKMFEILFTLAIVLGLLVLVGWLLKVVWLGLLAGISFIEIYLNFR